MENLYIYNREEAFAEYILKHNCTIRVAAKAFGISKSTLHNDIHTKLKKNNIKLYQKVHKILEKNFMEKHIRGGNATKLKMEQLKLLKQSSK